MKKVFSLLFVALLAMSAWADTTVTFIPGETVGSNVSASAADEMSKDGVKFTCTTAAFAATQYRFGGGSTTTITSTVGNIKKIEFTCLGSYSQNYGPDQLYGDGYSAHSGSNVGIWQGDASTITLKAASQCRATKIVVTIAEEGIEELVPPVFNPNGGEFSGSLAVTLSCPTVNCDIFYFEGDPDGDWAGFTHYNGTPFYVTETKTYTAYSTKGDEVSDYVTVTFTKVQQTVEAPVFTPAEGYFSDRIDVTLTCATPNAKIYYSQDNELWSEYVDPIPVTDDITIWAKAKVGDVESEVVSATYTKLPDTTVDVTFDAQVDKGNGEQSSRHSYTIVKDLVTMYVGDGTVYTDHYRIYKSDSAAFTFTSAGAPILKIQLNGMSGSNNPSNLSLPEGQSGTYTSNATTGVWEGNAQEVSFKINSQVRLYTIVVTLAGQEEPVYQPGDVNHDGFISIGDVTDLIDYLLTDTTLAPAEADFNNDGVVTIKDATDLIDYLLGGDAE
jgi:hypothetical protein